MPRAKRVCAKPGCPTPAVASYCTTHQAEADKARGNANARGYGSQHQRARARLNLEVQSGRINCARCGQPIQPNEPWHLDHDDRDRGKYIGPSHAFCNTQAGGRKAHANPS